MMCMAALKDTLGEFIFHTLFFSFFLVVDRRILKPHANIDTTFVDVNDEKALNDAFQENTKLLWVETPTNPTLKLADIRRCATIAHEHNCLLIVDNTFLSPYNQNPLDLGNKSLFGDDM